MNNRRKMYFLGISKIKSEPEVLFDEISGRLFPGCDRYYITKDKEIKESRRDIDGKCMVCDVREFTFNSRDAIFVPQASFWSDDTSLPWWERYAKFAELLFSRGIEDIIFGYIEEDAECWNYPFSLFLTRIEKALFERGYILTEIKYKDRTMLKVSLSSR